MEQINSGVLSKSLEIMASDLNCEFKASSDLEYELKTCSKCGDRIEMKLEVLDRERIVPVTCSCRKKEIEAIKTQAENRERQLRVEQIINNSLMDAEFKKCTFDNWDHNLGNEKMYIVAKKYANKFGDMKNQNIGLIVYGSPGNGKTYMSSAIANELIDRLIPVICVSAVGLMERIKKTFDGNGNEGVYTVLNALDNAELLIIDDLGTEVDSKWSRSTMYQIIDSRYRSEKPLIVTTNLTLDQLRDRYDDRTFDRLVNQMCTPVENKSRSIRIEKGKQKTKMLQELLSL